MRRPSPHAALALLALAAMLLACTRQAAAPSPTPNPTTAATPSPTAPRASATATPVATGLRSARDLDVRSPAIIGPLVDHFRGGEVPAERVVYADMTGDRVEDAVVVVESGGTLGDLGAAVFEVREGGAYLLGYVEAGGRLEVRFGAAVMGLLVVTQPVPAPGDPACCPSKLREVVYQWDGRQFARLSDQVIDNPAR